MWPMAWLTAPVLPTMSSKEPLARAAEPRESSSESAISLSRADISLALAEEFSASWAARLAGLTAAERMDAVARKAVDTGTGATIGTRAR